MDLTLFIIFQFQVCDLNNLCNKSLVGKMGSFVMYKLDPWKCRQLSTQYSIRKSHEITSLYVFYNTWNSYVATNPWVCFAPQKLLVK